MFYLGSEVDMFIQSMISALKDTKDDSHARELWVSMVIHSMCSIPWKSKQVNAKALRDLGRTFGMTNEVANKMFYTDLVTPYFVSQLGRAVVAFIQQGSLQTSASKYSATEADILFCIDVLRSSGTYNCFLKEANNIIVDLPIYSESFISEFLNSKILPSIRYFAIKKLSFVTKYDSGVSIDDIMCGITIKAVTIMRKWNRCANMVFLSNTLKTSLNNLVLNEVEKHTSQKRGVLVKTQDRDHDANQESEFSRNSVPLTDEIAQVVAANPLQSPDVPLKTKGLISIVSRLPLESKLRSKFENLLRVFFSSGNDDFYKYIESHHPHQFNKLSALSDSDMLSLAASYCNITSEEFEQFSSLIGKSLNFKERIEKTDKYADYVAELNAARLSQRVRDYILITKFYEYPSKFSELANDKNLNLDFLTRKELKSMALEYCKLNDLDKSNVNVWVKKLKALD